MAKPKTIAAIFEELGFTLEQTGGGCTAWNLGCKDGGYWLVTTLDDPCAPRERAQAVACGRYAQDSFSNDWSCVAMIETTANAILTRAVKLMTEDYN